MYIFYVLDAHSVFPFCLTENPEKALLPKYCLQIMKLHISQTNRR